MQTSQNKFKPLYSLLLLFVVAPLLAALISPWIYRGLQSFATEDSVLDAPFFRVTARVVLVLVAALLVPAYKLSGFKGRENWGLIKCPNRRRQVWLGIGLGVLSMLGVYLIGMALGAFAWDTRGKSGFYIARKVVQIFAGGLFIGFFEEILFRGFIQSALKKSLGLISAVLLGSFFFSIVHFMRPVNPEIMDKWFSGFLLFGNLFSRAGESFLQEAVTLFSMGVVLALLTHWIRSVYVAVGLHAGWVWVMMLFRLFSENQETMTWLYGTSDWVSKAWMGPIVAAVVLAAVVVTRKKWISLGAEE